MVGGWWRLKLVVVQQILLFVEVDVLYGMILLCITMKCCLPTFFCAGTTKKKYVDVATSPCRQNFADIVGCWRHIGDMSPTCTTKQVHCKLRVLKQKVRHQTIYVILSKLAGLIVRGILIDIMRIDQAINTRIQNALKRTTNNAQVTWMGAPNRKLVDLNCPPPIVNGGGGAIEIDKWRINVDQHLEVQPRLEYWAADGCYVFGNIGYLHILLTNPLQESKQFLDQDRSRLIRSRLCFKINSRSITRGILGILG